VTTLTTLTRLLLAYETSLLLLTGQTTSCPDDLSAEVSKQPGDLAEMRKLFEHWDPRLHILLDKVDTALKWKIWGMEELATWTKVQKS